MPLHVSLWMGAIPGRTHEKARTVFRPIKIKDNAGSHFHHLFERQKLQLYSKVERKEVKVNPYVVWWCRWVGNYFKHFLGLSLAELIFCQGNLGYCYILINISIFFYAVYNNKRLTFNFANILLCHVNDLFLAIPFHFLAHLLPIVSHFVTLFLTTSNSFWLFYISSIHHLIYISYI